MLNDETRERLRRFIEVTAPRIAARNAAWRAEGAAARTAGVSAIECPYYIGSFAANRWLEGWSGTLAPERKCVDGGGFNMTPQEDVARFTDWVASLPVTSEMAAKMLKAYRAGYRPEALPTTH